MVLGLRVIRVCAVLSALSAGAGVWMSARAHAFQAGVTVTGLASMLTKLAHALTGQYVVTYARPDCPPAKLVQATAKRGAKALTAPWVR